MRFALIELIREIKNNSGLKSRYTVFSYRLASFFYNGNLCIKFLLFPFYINYKLIVDFVFGVEIPSSVKIGWGLRISHAKCITIHPEVVIGRNCHLRHGVTIGNKSTGDKMVPIIFDNVDVGCFSSVLGEVQIGDNVKIGAHSLVLRSVQENSVVYGVPVK